MFNRKQKYDQIKDLSTLTRFYELWRGIADAFMKFIERILIDLGWYTEDEEDNG